MSKFKKTKLVTVSLWAVVLLWLVFIFALSAQPAAPSNEFSEKVTETIIQTIACIVQLDIDAKTINGLVSNFHNLVRKFAHGWIYFVLGILVIKAVIKTGIMGFKAHAIAILFCIIYAVIDEKHQLFVPGRSGEIWDVLIDTSGAILGIGVYWLFKILLRRRL